MKLFITFIVLATVCVYGLFAGRVDAQHQTVSQQPTGVARLPIQWPEVLRRLRATEAAQFPVVLDFRFEVDVGDNATILAEEAIATIVSDASFGYEVITIDIVVWDDSVCTEGELELTPTFVLGPEGAWLYDVDEGEPEPLVSQETVLDLMDLPYLLGNVNPQPPYREYMVQLIFDNCDEIEGEAEAEGEQ